MTANDPGPPKTPVSSHHHGVTSVHLKGLLSLDMSKVICKAAAPVCVCVCVCVMLPGRHALLVSARPASETELWGRRCQPATVPRRTCASRPVVCPSAGPAVVKTAPYTPTHIHPMNNGVSRQQSALCVCICSRN
ncbi:hypothetical protein ILYODFUR_011560 [Ilyodon furcidens]|uniref:Uncharacterized protein n=1 Tax=Ilyodon furcidens TaxID=33524 RepID=A0ABV0V3A0_9TELE